MAKKNKKNTKAYNKVLKATIEYFILMLRERGLNSEGYEFYCEQIDFNLSKYSGKHKEDLKKAYKLRTDWLIRHKVF